MSKLKAAFFSKTDAVEVVEVDIPTDVVTYTQQSLTDAQKEQARTNIGAGTYSKPSGGIPSSDMASAVQTSLGKADTALQSFTETDPTVPSWAKQSSKPSYNFSEIGSKPTTLSGYGITDAKIQNGTITLGSNTITPLTSFTETDPTVPSWAKQSTKPTYTAQEVGALPSSTPIPSNINDLSDVTTGTPSDGDVLTYDSATGKWVADEPQGGGATVLTQAEYDALVTKDPDTLYVVRPDDNSIYMVMTHLSTTLDIVEVGDGWDISDLTNNPPSSFYYIYGGLMDVNIWFPFDETGPSTWTLSGNTLTQSLSGGGLLVIYTLTDGIPTSATFSAI